ncbi:MAG: hypothetical protein LBV71_02680 [Prevotella sp.]|jgi:hypothetical protein|nr:hypothetical protein [Prevotella sp.]
MKNTRSILPTAVGLLTATAVAVVTSDYATASLASIAGQIGTGVAGNMLSSLIPSRLNNIEDDPEKLNHSIKKLFINSISQALSSVYITYTKDDNVTKKEKKEALKIVGFLQKGLTDELNNNSILDINENLVNDFLYQKDLPHNQDIISYILRKLAISETQISDSFKRCLSENYNTYIELTFGEGLKEDSNRNAWIAFQRLLIEDLRDRLVRIEDGQIRIEEKLTSLKDVNGEFTDEEMKVIRDLKKTLQDKELIKTHVSKTTTKRLKAIEANGAKVLSIITKTDVQVDNIYIIIKSFVEDYNRERRKAKRNIIILILFLIICFPLITYLTYNSFTQPFTLSIQTHGWKGKKHRPLEGVGTLEIVLGDKTEKAEISRNGEAIFKNVDHKYNKTSVLVRLLDTRGELYYVSDSTVFINKNKINYVQIGLKGIDELQGIIIDNISGDGLGQATVELAGVETTTDEKGRFRLSIPITKQEKKQEIYVYKEGYTTYRAMVPMGNENECRIVLKRK